MTERPHIARWRGRSGLLVAAVIVTALCWIAGNPRSSGPDEPSHMVTSAALVRGDREGRVLTAPIQPGAHGFEVPAMVGRPDPGCWAFDPGAPVSCQGTVPSSTDTVVIESTSFNYAPWALVLPGLASFVPSPGGYAYLARILNAAIPIALVCASLLLLVRRRAALAAAVLVGLTPIAWFTFGFVSPSAVAIGGGLALWTGLLQFDGSRTATVLTAAGWTAVLLPRRDGPLWAVMIVLACCLLVAMRPLELWARLDRWARWTVVGVAPLPLLTPLLNRDTDSNLVLAMAPLGLLVVELIARRYQRSRTAVGRIALLGGGALAAVVLAIGLVVARPGSVRGETVRLVVANTGDHLRQLVGNLGWMTTPVPAVAVYLFWAMVGGLALVAVLEHVRSALVYAAGLGAAIIIAWLLELGQTTDYGDYWQGRYTMPFAVGLPLVLAWRSPATEAWLVDRVATVVGWASWAVANVAFVAAQQRWGVGIYGTWNPFDWNTWGAPLPPLALIVVHGGSTAVLTLCCTTQRVRVLA